MHFFEILNFQYNLIIVLTMCLMLYDMDIIIFIIIYIFLIFIDVKQEYNTQEYNKQEYMLCKHIYFLIKIICNTIYLHPCYTLYIRGARF